jgi:AcrR family transcriptional regulator
VAATLRLLERTGDPSQVTVAAIVTAVGCTPPSLYHYWASREALLREASARGFAEFRRTQALAAAREQDALVRIRSRGSAYLEFAFARPSLFRVLFLDRTVPGWPAADVEDPGQGLADLITDVRAAMEEKQLRPGDPRIVAVGLWAAVHGVAALWAATPGFPRELAITVHERQADALLAGLAPSEVP